MTRGGKVHCRDMEREIRDAGGVFVRQKGSHRFFDMPNGDRLCLPMRADVCPKAESQIRRSVKANRLLQQAVPA